MLCKLTLSFIFACWTLHDRDRTLHQAGRMDLPTYCELMIDNLKQTRQILGRMDFEGFKLN